MSWNPSKLGVKYRNCTPPVGAAQGPVRIRLERGKTHSFLIEVGLCERRIIKLAYKYIHDVQGSGAQWAQSHLPGPLAHLEVLTQFDAKLPGHSSVFE
jgi:hypothetical protein